MNLRVSRSAKSEQRAVREGAIEGFQVGSIEAAKSKKNRYKVHTRQDRQKKTQEETRARRDKNFFVQASELITQ